MKKYLSELYKRKDLLIYLVISGLKAQHRNTYLGYLWWILDPLIMGALYYIVRVLIFGMTGEYVGAFLIIGLITWKWITAVLSGGAKSISSKSGIITQVYLPKAIFPIGAVFTQLANFIFSIPVIIASLLLYQLAPGVVILAFPLIMAIQVLFLIALSLVLAYICMFIRDIENVISYVITVGFWMSPVIWEASRLPEQYQFIIRYNPAAVFMTSYRNIFMHQAPPLWNSLAIIACASIVVIIFMLYYYSKNEHKIIRAI